MATAGYSFAQYASNFYTRTPQQCEHQLCDENSITRLRMCLFPDRGQGDNRRCDLQAVHSKLQISPLPSLADVDPDPEGSGCVALRLV